MNRNVNDHFTHTPTPHFPRNRFDMGLHKKLFTMQHGRLVPFYCRAVYPGDLWTDNPVPFIRMDTSFRVPLDEIYLDTYFFFVPFRILDDNFAKILGDKDVFDDTEYSIPQLEIKAYDLVEGEKSYRCLFSSDNVLTYLGYSQADAVVDDNGFYAFGHPDKLTAYPVAAYYKIFNDWFRDENLDSTWNISDLYGMVIDAENSLAEDPWNFLDALKVNRYHDYFSSATISPQKGPAVTIPLGTSAPIIGDSALHTSGNIYFGDSSKNTYPGANLFNGNSTDGKPGALYVDQSTSGTYTAEAGVTSNNLIADLSKAAGSINELRLSFAIQSLYERRNRFGTRYIETIRGQWGIEVPDSFFQRPEYLGGSRVTLNNVPVLSTENSSQLGQMAGNSATTGGSNAFSKQFIEYGVIIGLCCTRVHHSYGQGKRKELWSLKTGLDLYNPVFANIGFQPIMENEIYNQGTENDDVFAYQEAWSELRMEMDEYKGLFGIFSSNSELKNKWHYGDYYDAAPEFSAEWLKEDPHNVARTLTGRLINGATMGDGDSESEFGHQFMIGYYVHPKVTRILPAHSIPVELIGRL